MGAPPDLDKAQWQADPHADRVIEKILGPWPARAAGLMALPMAESADDATKDDAIQARIARIKLLNEILRTWESNGGVAGWKAPAGIAAGMAAPLEEYVKAAMPQPPEWADRKKLEVAEQLFMDYGALSVTILFCASLPECYVVPDLASVLQATGQLIHRADHRIRATGAMVFPAMMVGGLTTADGAGIAQILKVRLIHASVRNLILRGSPEAAAAAESTGATIPPLAHIQDDDDMHEALFVHGWDLGEDALPNNQEELAYTLLTFSYVFLRSLHKLGIPFTKDEEEAYLHLWNVAGSYLGIRRELMADTMAEAAALFDLMQQRGRDDWTNTSDKRNDPRPALGKALMASMETAIPWTIFKPFPRLLTRMLLEPASVRDLGLEGDLPFLSRVLFAIVMGSARWIDDRLRRVFPGFSIARLLTRAIGYRLMCRLMMDETRDLAVPGRLRPDIRALVAHWGQDKEASPWMNFVENSVTTFGAWEPLKPESPPPG